MKAPVSLNTAEFLRSSFYEQLAEHVIISELLQEAWYRHEEVVEVLRAEVDASGFDLALECRGILRHVQLRTSRATARTGSQKVALALGRKPRGCVVWLRREENGDQHRMRLRFLWLGGAPGEPLPDLGSFKTARHTKPNSKGVKTERPGLKVVPKAEFTRVDSMAELLRHLFGLGDSR
jgi:hypothetical protein